MNRAKSLYVSSKQALITALEIKHTATSSKTILRELYEALREICEALGYERGFKFTSHESITHFLKDFLNERSISTKFNRYRILRNQINYYGKNIDFETIEKARKEIPFLIKHLENHLSLI